MTQELLEILRQVTPEEERLRSGNTDIEKNIYTTKGEENADSFHIDAEKLLDDGKLIQIRTHTRFVHFPVHTHNFVEVVYMCEGSTHHVINGNDVLPIQNLIENLIWTIIRKEPNKRSIQQATMGLLFLQLMNQIDRMETAEADKQQKLAVGYDNTSYFHRIFQKQFGMTPRKYRVENGK